MLAKTFLPLVLLQAPLILGQYCGAPNSINWRSNCDWLLCKTPWNAPVPAQDSGEQICKTGPGAYESCGPCTLLPLSSAFSDCCTADDYATCFANFASSNCGGSSNSGGSSASSSAAVSSSGSASASSSASSSPNSSGSASASSSNAPASTGKSNAASVNSAGSGVGALLLLLLGFL